jgi:hypothetical protein
MRNLFVLMNHSSTTKCSKSECFTKPKTKKTDGIFDQKGTISIVESTKQKYFKLNIAAELKLKLLLGQLTIHGLADYLNTDDEKPFSYTFIYDKNLKGTYEEFDISMKIDENIDTIEESIRQGFTHIVYSVQNAVPLFLRCEIKSSTKEALQNISGKLKVELNKPQISIDAQVSGEMIEKDYEKDYVLKMHIELPCSYGDLEIEEKFHTMGKVEQMNYLCAMLDAQKSIFWKPKEKVASCVIRPLNYVFASFKDKTFGYIEHKINQTLLNNVAENLIILMEHRTSIKEEIKNFSSSFENGEMKDYIKWMKNHLHKMEEYYSFISNEIKEHLSSAKTGNSESLNKSALSLNGANKLVESWIETVKENNKTLKTINLSNEIDKKKLSSTHQFWFGFDLLSDINSNLDFEKTFKEQNYYNFEKGALANYDNIRHLNEGSKYLIYLEDKKKNTEEFGLLVNSKRYDFKFDDLSCVVCKVEKKKKGVFLTFEKDSSSLRKKEDFSWKIKEGDKELASKLVGEKFEILCDEIKFEILYCYHGLVFQKEEINYKTELKKIWDSNNQTGIEVNKIQNDDLLDFNLGNFYSLTLEFSVLKPEDLGGKPHQNPILSFHYSTGDFGGWEIRCNREKKEILLSIFTTDYPNEFSLIGKVSEWTNIVVEIIVENNNVYFKVNGKMKNSELNGVKKKTKSVDVLVFLKSFYDFSRNIGSDVAVLKSLQIYADKTEE